MNGIAEVISWTELARVQVPGGAELLLRRRGDAFEIRADGRELMTTRAHASEDAMARLACAHLEQAASPRVLIGGLGMGYTLRAALDTLPASGSVTVAELVPEIVAWNRRWLSPLAGHPLDDPRVVVHDGDVRALLEASSSGFDAILLDADNGPEALTHPDNDRLYSAAGLDRARRALRPGGVLAIWSADPSPTFLARLGDAGFAAEAVDVPARGSNGDPNHTIFLACI